MLRCRPTRIYINHIATSRNLFFHEFTEDVICFGCDVSVSLPNQSFFLPGRSNGAAEDSKKIRNYRQPVSSNYSGRITPFGLALGFQCFSATFLYLLQLDFSVSYEYYRVFLLSSSCFHHQALDLSRCHLLPILKLTQILSSR